MCFYDITRNHNPRSPKIGQYLAVPRGNVHEFKRSKRYIKTVSMDVISLGFPEQTVPKWLNGYVFVQEGQIRCRMRKKFDEVEFHNWKEVVSVNVADRFTPHTAVDEKSLRKLLNDLLK